MLAFLSSEIGTDPSAGKRPLPKAGYYLPDLPTPTLGDVQARWSQDRPVACLVFYRSPVLAGNTAPVDAMIGTLSGPVWIVCRFSSPVRRSRFRRTLGRRGRGDWPVGHSQWHRLRGLQPRKRPDRDTLRGGGRTRSASDLLRGGQRHLGRQFRWSVSPRHRYEHALPEVDGRLTTVPSPSRRSPAGRGDAVSHRDLCAGAGLIVGVAALAANWRGCGDPAKDRRVATVLANYP